MVNDQIKKDILRLDGREVGLTRLTFFQQSDMTMTNVERFAEMIIDKTTLFDDIPDINQIVIWKITEIFKNSSGANIAIKISYSQDKPTWINDTIFTDLLLT